MVEKNKFERHLNIDVVLQIRIAKHFFRNPKRLTLEKVQLDLSKYIDLKLYDFSEDETYFLFTLKNEVADKYFFLFLFVHLFWLGNLFKESDFDKLENISIEEILNNFQDGELLSDNNANLPIYFMKDKYFYFNLLVPGTYELEMSTIKYFDSGKGFFLEGSSYTLQYLKNLIEKTTEKKEKFPYGGTVFINYYNYEVADEKDN